MVKKSVLIVKVVVSLLLVAPIFVVSYMAIWGEKYEEKREVLDTVISEDGSHKAIVTKIGDSYGYDDTVEFALFDDEGKQNAVFTASIYELNQGEDRYSVEWDTEQVFIRVNAHLNQSQNMRIVVDYDDLAGRDVRIQNQDDCIVYDSIWCIGYLLFAVSTILLMFSKKLRKIFGLASAVLLIITISFTFGLNIRNHELTLNDVIYEDDPNVKHSITLSNENCEFLRGRLYKVHLYYSCLAPEHKNVFLLTYASGKVDKTQIDVVFHDPDSLTITFQGEDSFAFTVVRE